MLKRRSFLGAMLAACAAPAIVKADIIMPVKKIITDPHGEFGFIEPPRLMPDLQRIMEMKRAMMESVTLGSSFVLFMHPMLAEDMRRLAKSDGRDISSPIRGELYDYGTRIIPVRDIYPSAADALDRIEELKHMGSLA